MKWRKAVLIVLGVLAAFMGMPALGADTPVVIKLWNPNSAQKKFYQQVFKSYNAANPDIKVEYTAQTSPEAMAAALDTAFKAGDPPDLFTASIPTMLFPRVWTDVIPGGMAKAVEMGLLTPLDAVASSKEALAAWIAKFPQQKQPFVETLNMFNGKVYSWPVGAPGLVFGPGEVVPPVLQR